MRDVLLSQTALASPNLSNGGKRDEQVRRDILTCAGSVVKMFAAWLKEVNTLLKRPLRTHLRCTSNSTDATSALTTMLTGMLSVCRDIVRLMAADALMFHCEKPLGSVVVLLSISWPFLTEASVQVFLWNPPTRSSCSQPGRQEKRLKFLRRGSIYLGRTLHHPSRKFGSPGSTALGKMKQRTKLMKYT